MKARCLHGFYIFEETKVGQFSDFMSYFGLNLVPKDDYFTFEFLAQAPKYSIKGKPFLGFTAIKTFQGHPWEVFEANGVIYDFDQGTLKPINSVTQKTTVRLAGNRFVSTGLILPGSITDDGQRVKDYAAHFSQDRLKWLYSEVSYV